MCLGAMLEYVHVKMLLGCCHVYMTMHHCACMTMNCCAGMLSMVSAGAIPDLIADLPDHAPPGLENLRPVPEGFGQTPTSPSTPSTCRLQQLPYTPEVQRRPKASSPLVPRRQLFTAIHSDEISESVKSTAVVDEATDFFACL